ncbi:MAG: hypothetical protein K2N05_09855 [Muribaculaceae bacterium]|nr:hypothetical protein [Muribaculaceae bacterium]
MIESEIFSISKSEFATILFQRHGLPWIAGGSLMLLTAIFLGFALDYRIFILAVILLFLIAPAVLLILYYNYGMKGKSFLNVLPHRIQIFNERTVIWLKVKECEPEEADRINSEKRGAATVECGDETGEKSDIKNDEEWRRYDFSLECYGNYSVGKNYVVFPFLTPEGGFLYLPLKAFRSEEEFSKAVSLMAGTNLNKKENEDNKG